MSTAVDLDFHDGGGDDVLFDQSSGQTHTFHNFPTSAVDEDEEEGGDKSQLLKEEDGKKSPSFWTFEYYQQFFDVETRQVLQRVTGSMLPIPKRNHLKINIRPNPDLYGPFWICTTLVFTTAIAGNLANYLSSAGKDLSSAGKDYHWKYDFHKVTFAATAIFSYWWLIPGIMYSFLWWRKSQAGYTFLEILCVYGYSMAIYIPISILWVINITWFKWVLVIVGAVMSGGVLVITFWPAVKDDTKNIAFAFVGLIFLFHLGLAAGFVLYFFHVPPQASVTVQTTPVPTPKPLIPEKLRLEFPKTVAAKLNDNSKAANNADVSNGNSKTIAGGTVKSGVEVADVEKLPDDGGTAGKDNAVGNADVIDNGKGEQAVKDDGIDKNKALTEDKTKRNAIRKGMNRQKA